MQERWRDLLVLIEVPLHNGRKECSTGLPVGQDRIITSRHGLFPVDLTPDAPIHINWFHQPDSIAPPVRIERSAILW